MPYRAETKTDVVSVKKKNVLRTITRVALKKWQKTNILEKNGT